jgi:hypothetical protein
MPATLHGIIECREKQTPGATNLSDYADECRQVIVVLLDRVFR